ncbi:MAG TPA: type VI secretion system tube protein TssD [Candidatus Acidoferrales bacterium]|nr:type VI secretion system tube protein TssD [Candidatus Acidoferrales bacterium]
MKAKHAVMLAAFALTCLAPVKATQAQQPGKVIMPQQQIPAKVFVTIVGKLNRTIAQRLPVLRFSYEVDSPRNPATGLPSGARQHKPVVFTTDWGAATPLLFQAATTNEVLASVLFEFVRPDGAVYQTVKLTNATIASTRLFVGPQAPGEPPSPFPLEETSMTFQKIELADIVGKTAAMDDWSSRQ